MLSVMAPASNHLKTYEVEKSLNFSSKKTFFLRFCITAGANIIKNTAVIYCHFRLNYRSIYVTLNLRWNGSKLLLYFNRRKSRVKITGVNYRNKLPQYFL